MLIAVNESHENPTPGLIHIWCFSIYNSRTKPTLVALSLSHIGFRRKHDFTASKCSLNWPADPVRLEKAGVAECVGRQVALTLVSHRLVVRRTALRTAR